MSSDQKHEKDESLLTGIAESVGSTLGAIAANAKAVSDALSDKSLPKTMKREGKKFARKGKSFVRKIQKTSKSLKRNKSAMATRKTATRKTLRKPASAITKKKAIRSKIEQNKRPN